MENREKQSRLGFIMLSARGAPSAAEMCGCAGKQWRSFMLIYVICLVVLSLPTMIMEIYSWGVRRRRGHFLYVSSIGGRGKWNPVGHRLSHQETLR